MRHRLPRFLLGFVLLLVPLWAVLSLDLREPRPEREPVVLGGGLQGSGRQLLAGVARVELTPSEPVPLGGYFARRGQTHIAVRDEVHGRVLVLHPEANNSPALALVVLDMVLVPQKLAEELRERTLRELPGIGEVFVTATHTHAGPGGTWDNRIAAIGGMGRFHEAYTEQVLERVFAAVAEAWEARVPVDLDFVAGEGPAVCRNRERSTDSDRRMTVAELRGEAGPLARIVVFACHPTFLGHTDRRLSAGWPGEMERRLDGFTFFLQGAVGDQRPAWVDTGLKRQIEAMGEGLDLRSPEGRMIGAGALVAAAVVRLEATIAAGRSGHSADEAGDANDPAEELSFGVGSTLAWRTSKVALPLPSGENMAPFGLRNITGKLLSRVAEDEVRVGLLRLSELGIVFVPAEVVSSVAGEWEREVESLTGLEHVRVVSLADGYAGYLETEDALDSRTGESKRAWYGAEATSRIGAAIRALAEAMVSAAPPDH